MIQSGDQAYKRQLDKKLDVEEAEAESESEKSFISVPDSETSKPGSFSIQTAKDTKELQFEFPHKSFAKLEWQSVQAVKQYFRKLVEEGNQEAKLAPFRLKIHRQNHHSLFECKLCKAKIVFVCEADNSAIKKLVQFNNKHLHTQTDSKKMKDYDIAASYMEKIPVEEIFTQKSEVIAKKLAIDLNQCRKAIRDLIRKYSYHLSQLIKKIEKSKAANFFQAFVSKVEDGKEKKKRYFTFMTTSSMKKSYAKYGDYVCFDEVARLYITHNDKEKACVVFFSGQDSHLRVVFFGVGIIWEADEKVYANLFTQFFKQMGKQPKCFITENSREIMDAVQLLKKNFIKQNKWSHGIAPQAVVRRIQERLKMCYSSEQEKQQILSLFQQAVTVFDRTQYEKYVLKLKKICRGDQYLEKLVKDFQDGSSKYCMVHLKRRMHGFGMQFYRKSSFEECLKKNFPEQCSPLKLFYYVLHYEKNYSARLNHFQKISPGELPQKHDCQEMRFLSEKLERNVYCVLLQNFKDSKDLNPLQLKEVTSKPVISEMKNDGAKMASKKTKDAGQKIRKLTNEIVSGKFMYSVIYENEKEKVWRNNGLEFWKCSCGFREVTGIACKHLICIILKFKQSIAHYIAKRWFYGEEDGLKKEVWYNEATMKRQSQQGKESEEQDDQRNSEIGALEEEKVDSEEEEGFEALGGIDFDQFVQHQNQEMDSEDNQIMKQLMK